MNWIKENIRFNELACIEAKLQGEVCTFNFVQLKKKASKIVVELEEIGLSLSELEAFANKKIPTVLTINGQEVLHRQLKGEAETEEEMVQKILPGAKREQFYLQKYLGENQKVWLSLIRKSRLDELLKNLQNQSWCIVSIGLGGYNLASLLLLDENVSGLNVLEHRLQVGTDGLIDHYQVHTDLLFDTENKNCLAKLELKEEASMVAYASGLAYFLGNQCEVLLPEVEHQKEEQQYKKVFQKLAWGMLIGTLLVLLGNAVLFMDLFEKNNQAKGAIEHNQQAIAKVEALEAKIKTQDDFLNKMGGNLSRSKTTYYVDNLMGSMPQYIRLNKLSFVPVVEKKNEIKLEKNILLLEGISENSLYLNNWIKEIKNIDWVKEVDIELEETKFQLMVHLNV